ncbi:MAG TPA: RnfH family protein [Usitatibacter sp.]|nr:RnfH family protein [Usitatibacter sp.]
MRVSVAVALAGRQEVVELELPSGATAEHAIRAANIAQRFPQLGPGPWRLGIWSRPCEPSTALREGDRVECYRELVADPKEQRRNRARLKPSTRSRSGS